MNDANTHGVRVSVEMFFNEEMSLPQNKKYVFSYEVEIENQTKFTLQLMEREWFVYDSAGVKQRVKGEGVIGENPILEPGEIFSYTSGAQLSSPYGKMHGFYYMKELETGRIRKVQIPEFTLQNPLYLN